MSISISQLEEQTITALEMHSNFEMSDDELIACVEEGLVDEETVLLYSDILTRMTEGNLTYEDNAAFLQILKEGYIDINTYSVLVEDGVVDLDLSKDILFESMLMENAQNTGNANAPAQNVQNNQANNQKQANQPAPAAQPQNQSNLTPQQSKFSNFVRGTMNVGRRVAAVGARGVAKVAGALGANKLAAGAYKFAANRYANAGDKAKADNYNNKANKYSNLATQKANEKNNQKQTNQPAPAAQPQPQTASVDYRRLNIGGIV